MIRGWSFGRLGRPRTIDELVASLNNELAALNAALQTPVITTGQLQNAANTAGVLLSGTLPSTWTRYLNLNGSGIFLKHDQLELLYDGTATFKGVIDSLDATIVEGAGGVVIRLRDSDVAHGVTGLFTTDTYGAFGPTSGTTGGLIIYGVGESGAGVFLNAIVTTPDTVNQGAINLIAQKKSGTGVTDLAADDLAFTVINNTSNQKLIAARGNGAVSTGVGGSGSINRVAHTPFTAANLTTTSTALTDLAVYSLPADALDRDGAGVEITFEGLAGVTDALVQIGFGSQNAVSVTVDNDTPFSFTVRIIRRATSSQRSGGLLVYTDTAAALQVVPTGGGVLTQDETAAINIDFRCDQVGAGTFTLFAATVKFLDPDTTNVA